MLLVTGATAQVGGAVAAELDALGADFAVLVRDPARATALPASARRITGDLDDVESLRKAFAGVSALFLVVPGTGLDHTANAVAAAKDAGVGRIVLLSSLLADGEPVPAMGRWHRAREEMITASGIPATFLRPGGFMSNALEWAGTLREGGYVLDPMGPGRYAPIDPADIAAVAAAVLTGEGHERATYALTGDERVTIAEQAAVLAAELGREIEVRTAASPEDAVRARFPHGAPPELAAALVESFTAARSNTEGFASDDVRRLLGRPAGTFADWCRRNAHLF
ncbi:nucleotide-diphosphate-sugar epimerase [Actinorhabdospora filicis]|uniref:Nucleotide-diphosphate-sugar epimerase n=1 Tax=Actinorhabdospora filicis TaxID=1785913 RepID=A0A9W6SGV2_9ACTN|nr:NAD(P)H-binding protein [Actinorhabdospora filicis]GLZ76904.1 nucleotide-diphosphate-sugar epimerase [Actinorhabdospora filicis]